MGLRDWGTEDLPNYQVVIGLSKKLFIRRGYEVGYNS